MARFHATRGRNVCRVPSAAGIHDEYQMACQSGRRRHLDAQMFGALLDDKVLAQVPAAMWEHLREAATAAHGLRAPPPVLARPDRMPGRGLPSAGNDLARVQRLS
jgi:hypothetical protein